MQRSTMTEATFITTNAGQRAFRGMASIVAVALVGTTPWMASQSTLAQDAPATEPVPTQAEIDAKAQAEAEAAAQAATPAPVAEPAVAPIEAAEPTQTVAEAKPARKPPVRRKKSDA